MGMAKRRIDRRGFLSLAGKTVAGAMAASALPGLLMGQAAAAGPRKPNFIIILTDDQGYQDLGSFGSPNIKTPRLDRMAAEGIRLTSFYAAPVCTPSRAQIMTGCYATRVGLPAVLNSNSRIGISDNEITLAQLLKAQGYATACVGKWHLGSKPPFLPTRHGFDSYYGIPYSNDMKPTPLMRDETVIEEPVDLDTVTERYTDEALKIIKANKDKPFFLYLAHTMPHTPLHIGKDFTGKSPRGLYGDVIQCIDWSTGKIFDTLKELGLDDNTLVVFFSDNGPWLSKGKDGGSALPLRRGKATTFEGGVRVPFIARWPGRIAAGKSSADITCEMDLMPTIAKLAGTAAPSDRIIDGKDIWPLLASGAAGDKPIHDSHYYYRGNTLEAVRWGKWKYHLARSTPPATAKATSTSVPADGPANFPALYDLEADVGEKVDQSRLHPDIVGKLAEMAFKFEAEMVANRRPPGRVLAETTSATAPSTREAK